MAMMSQSARMFGKSSGRRWRPVHREDGPVLLLPDPPPCPCSFASHRRVLHSRACQILVRLPCRWADRPVSARRRLHAVENAHITRLPDSHKLSSTKGRPRSHRESDSHEMWNCRPSKSSSLYPSWLLASQHDTRCPCRRLGWRSSATVMPALMIAPSDSCAEADIRLRWVYALAVARLGKAVNHVSFDFNALAAPGFLLRSSRPNPPPQWSSFTPLPMNSTRTVSEPGPEVVSAKAQRFEPPAEPWSLSPAQHVRRKCERRIAAFHQHLITFCPWESRRRLLRTADS